MKILSDLLEAEVKKQKKLLMKEMVKSLKENTPVDTGEAQSGWQIDQNNITNDVEYLSALNAGSSQQAPEHFIEKTLLSFPGVKPKGTIV